MQILTNDIVNDGLVLYLDAGIKGSYSGSGTTWTDLAGSNNGTLINGPTFDSANGGSIFFDGGSNGVQLPHNNTWVLPSSEKFSLCSWFYAEPTTKLYSMIFSHQKCNNPVFQITVESTNNLNFRVTGNSNIFARYNQNVTGRWNYVVCTFDGISGSMKMYLNGTLVASNTNTGGWSTYSPGYSEVWLGRRFPCGNEGEFTGKIASFYFYREKELTIQEVTQNFEATRNRFGI